MSTMTASWPDWLAQPTLGVERALWLVWAATIAVYAPSLVHAAFLSDDVAILAGVYAWHQAGHLWSHIGALFLERLPTGNNYYRPLPFVSFALDLTWFGVKASGWHVCNLALHLLSTGCVYGLANRLMRQPGTTGAPAALVAALLFALSPVGPEVVIWVAGRYDAMATAPVLLSLYWLTRSRNGHDGPAVASWCAAMIGLMSKESAAVIVPISALVASWAAAERHSFRSGRYVREVLQWWLPFAGLAAVYLAWRWHTFGTPLRVYASSPVAWDVDVGLALSSAWRWFGGLVPQAADRWLIVVLMPATLLWIAGRARLLPRIAWVGAGAAIAALIALGLVLPHKSAFASTGEDARFFYTSSAFVALALAVAAVPGAARQRIGGLGLALASATAVAAMIATVHNVQRWVATSDSMNALLPALRARTSTLPPEAYALVLIPDRLGPVPFGRNAQGGLVQPPLQPVPLSTHLVPVTPEDLGAWYEKLRRGILPVLRSHSLDDVMRIPLPPPAPMMPDTFVPSRYLCWKPEARNFAVLSDIDASDGSRWQASWRRALAEAGCEALARAVR
ncbi:MAG: hypothetical protein ABI349_00750 [Casimicrobiaceae bacterium]